MNDKQLYRQATDKEVHEEGKGEYIYSIPVGPDYQVAMTEMHRLRWAETNDGPYAERFGYAYVEGVKVYKISDFDTACRIVDAALGLGGDV